MPLPTDLRSSRRRRSNDRGRRRATPSPSPTRRRRPGARPRCTRCRTWARRWSRSSPGASPSSRRSRRCPSGWSTRSSPPAAITAWGGRKRQLQFIGKLMRDVDPAPIRASARRVGAGSRRSTPRGSTRSSAGAIGCSPSPTRSMRWRPSTRRSTGRGFRSLIARARTERARGVAAARLPRALSRAEGARSPSFRTEPSAPLTQPPLRIAMNAADRPRLDLRPRVVRRLRGQGHPGTHRMVHRGAAQRRGGWRRGSSRTSSRVIERTLIELVDVVGCHLVLTTGGTGPAPRDVTPEATLAVAHKVLPGFGEQMRQVSLKYVPTAILSRQVGVVRGRALILNLPGQPKAIKETLDGDLPRGAVLHRPHRRPVRRDRRRRCARRSARSRRCGRRRRRDARGEPAAAHAPDRGRGIAALRRVALGALLRRDGDHGARRLRVGRRHDDAARAALLDRRGRHAGARPLVRGARWPQGPRSATLVAHGRDRLRRPGVHVLHRADARPGGARRAAPLPASGAGRAALGAAAARAADRRRSSRRSSSRSPACC